MQCAAFAQRHANHPAPCLVALRMASGTSRALPEPYPTRPLRSPTTTSAAKPNRRPPFTTLATRLMLTSFSANSLSSRSRACLSLSARARLSLCVRAMSALSEIEAALSGGFGQRLHPAVVEISTAIEYDPLDPGLLGSLGDELADRARRGGIRARSQARFKPLIEARCSRQGPPRRVIADLRIYMLRRAEYRKAWPIVCNTAQFRPHAPPPAQKKGLGLVRHWLFLLAFLAADRLRRIFDAFALIRLGRPETADLGGDLPDALAVGPAYGNCGWPFTHDLDIAGDRVGDLVTVAELQIELIPLNGGTIADTVDFEGNREPLRHPRHHVADQGSRCSPHRPRVLGLIPRRDRDRPIGNRRGDVVADDELQGPKIAFGAQRLARELHLNPARDRYRMLTNSRHGKPQNTRHRTSPPTLAARASLSDITPLGVDRIEMPSPL